MRHRREQLSPGFRGSELRWLFTGVLTLAVLLMLMLRLREPGSLSWLSGGGKAAEGKTPAAPAKKPPPATGPTDEDPDQAETADEELQAVTDGTTGLGNEEMDSYNRIVFWVKNQSFARLWQRAKKNLAYTYLHDEPDKHRRELVALDVTISLVNDAGKNDDGVPLHEVWATTRQSGSRLYALIVVDLPKGLSIGRPARQENARFAGYFMKLQGYEAALSKPGSPPERAPLLIGRIEWTPPATQPATDARQEWLVGLTVLGIGAFVFIVRFALLRRGRGKPDRGGILTARSDSVIPVEQWLEHSGFMSPDEEALDGASRSEHHSVGAEHRARGEGNG
jgi:hypothetical protein